MSKDDLEDISEDIEDLNKIRDTIRELMLNYPVNLCYQRIIEPVSKKLTATTGTSISEQAAATLLHNAIIEDIQRQRQLVKILPETLVRSGCGDTGTASDYVLDLKAAAAFKFNTANGRQGRHLHGDAIGTRNVRQLRFTKCGHFGPCRRGGQQQSQWQTLYQLQQLCYQLNLACRLFFWLQENILP